MDKLFAALFSVHSEVGTLPKDGWNDQSSYSFAKGDTVVREARKLLAKHGLMWVRTGARPVPPTLAPGNLGNKMSYVGDVEITGKVVHHETGAALDIVGQVPIVAMAARPHDKAWAASITFGTGYTLLGVLNQDKADHAEINERTDTDRPTCTGVHEGIANENRDMAEELARIDDTTRESVWAWALDKAGINEKVGPKSLFVDEGEQVAAILRKLLASKSKPATRETNDRPRCSGKAAAIANSIRDLADQLAEGLGTPSSKFYADAVRECNILSDYPSPPKPEDLYVDHGKLIKVVLTKWLPKPEPEPEDPTAQGAP